METQKPEPGESDSNIRPKDACPKCGGTKMELRRYGMTGTLGRIHCSNCGKDIREWDAY